MGGVVSGASIHLINTQQRCSWLATDPASPPHEVLWPGDLVAVCLQARRIGIASKRFFRKIILQSLQSLQSLQ